MPNLLDCMKNTTGNLRHNVTNNNVKLIIDVADNNPFIEWIKGLI